MSTDINMNSYKKRIWEIDFLRGIAVLSMISFHIAYDLAYFYNFPLDCNGGILYVIGKSAVILFLLVAGISTNLSKNVLKHGIKISAAAILISASTYIINPDYYVRFGILHCLGTSLIIYSFISHLPAVYTALLSILSLYTGLLFSNMTVDYDRLFPIGLTCSRFSSSDYYPLFPWMCVFLVGTIIGKSLYSDKKSLFIKNRHDNILCVIGRRSLVIYLLHQPVLLGIMYVIFYCTSV